jgi:hypothetical protein
MLDWLFNRKPIVFHWVREGDRWLLTSPDAATYQVYISVAFVDGSWAGFVGDRRVFERYNSEIGAKSDAWQFILSKRKALFGNRRVELLDDA